MKKYTVTVVKTSRAYFEVEAGSKKEAMKRANDQMDQEIELLFDDENEPDIEVAEVTKITGPKLKREKLIAESAQRQKIRSLKMRA
jgi:methionine-rich copper-binding protein CopC